jgi:hypothetical protein
MAAEWAKTHGFTVTSESRAPAQETLPDSLCQLPLLRRGREPETRYVLERSDESHDLETIIFGSVTSRNSLIPWRGLLFAGSPPSDSPLFMTVFAFRRRALHWPAFVLLPAKIGERLQDDDLLPTRVELSGKPRFAERYTLRAKHTAELERVFSDKVVSALEREPLWCLEGLGEWCIFYHCHGKGFWTLRPSPFDDCAKPDQLSALFEVAHHLFRQMTARLS